MNRPSTLLLSMDSQFIFSRSLSLRDVAVMMRQWFFSAKVSIGIMNWVSATFSTLLMIKPIRLVRSEARLRA